MKKSLFTYCLFISVLISFPLLASSVDYNLQILNVNTENFPDAVFVEFTVTDAEGNFIPNLTQNDFTIKDNAIKKFGCKRLVQDLTEQQLPIDIVFIVDNSVSMSDEQDKISEALPLLLEGLSKKGDVRVGLIRFGDSDYNPSASQWGVVEKNNMGFFFSSLSDSADIRSFVETIWKQNRYDGVYEPYYNVLDWSARQDFGYRNNAVRIFIMLGDEPYCNNYNNSKTPLSEDEVCSVLSEYGIQTFIIQSEYNKQEYAKIINRTGGAYLDVTSDRYDTLLTYISDKIKGRYIFRYCIETDNFYDICKDVRTCTIEYKEKTVSRLYRPIRSVVLERSKSTRALDTLSVSPNTTVPLSVIVRPNGNKIDKVSLYFRNDFSSSFRTRTNPDSTLLEDGGIEYSFSVPALYVKGTLIEYYFEAEASSEFNEIRTSYKVTSPVYTNNLFTWTFPISPYKTPVIANVQSQVAIPCHMLNINAEVKDDDLSSVVLYYRISDISSVYHSTLMSNIYSSSLYTGLVPAESLADKSIDFFIVATDMQGIQSSYGEAAHPIVLPIESLPTASHSNPMEIFIAGLEKIHIGCHPISERDTIAAYYTIFCGGDSTDILSSSATWDQSVQGFRLLVYGNTAMGNSVKNGFSVGEKIKLKLIQNGYDYLLENHQITYSPNARITDFPYLGIGPKEPQITFVLSDTIIQDGDVIDFGICREKTTLPVLLKNTGCEKLYIRDVIVNNSFFELTPLLKDSLLPNEDLWLYLSYLPIKDIDAILEIHTNVPSKHLYQFPLKGNSSETTPCSLLRMQPEYPNINDTISLSLHNKVPYKFEVHLKPTCSADVIWSSIVEPNTNHTIHVPSIQKAGSYKWSIYTAESLCEYLFDVIP